MLQFTQFSRCNMLFGANLGCQIIQKYFRDNISGYSNCLDSPQTLLFSIHVHRTSVEISVGGFFFKLKHQQHMSSLSDEEFLPSHQSCLNILIASIYVVTLRYHVPYLFC